MNVVSDLASLARDCPNWVFFAEADQSVTARKLLEGTRQVASGLQRAGVVPGDRVVVALSRGLDASIAIYGILHYGAIYIPVDVASPAERLRFIASDAGAVCVIGKGTELDWANDLEMTHVDLNDLPEEQYGSLSAHTGSDEAIAAILYTSGSTGRPKGVALSHRAINAFIMWMRQHFALQSEDRIASLAPFHFDLSLFDLFGGPLIGATTLFIPDTLKLAPAKLVDWLSDHAITTWYTVPSILAFISLKGGLHDRPLSAMKRILFAGEVFPTARLMRLTEQLPHISFHNLFGPTETNVCLCWTVDADRLDPNTPVPIGQVACDAETKTATETSELLVRGPCLMSGYWRDDKPELPLNDEGWYCTGDRVSVNERGEYLYHGRLDRMIKSAGYRIEPAEVERVLNAVQGVEGSVVLGVPDAVSGTRLIAVVAGIGADQRTLRARLQEHLPAYMRPAYYHMMEALPLLPNGKTDIQGLTEQVLGELP